MLGLSLRSLSIILLVSVSIGGVAYVSGKGHEPPQDVAAIVAAISSDRMLADISRLTEFNGRQTATADDVRSARYIVDRFKALALQPAGVEALEDDTAPWVMTAPANVVTITDTALLSFDVGGEQLIARLGEDYLPVLDSPSLALKAPLVFVGYGISDPGRGLDEYVDVDVRGKVVVFFRGKPDSYGGLASHAEKMRVARERGARAYLMLTPPILSAYEARHGTGHAPLAYYAQSGSSAGEQDLAGAWISISLGEKLFERAARPLRQRQEELVRTLKPQSSMLAIQAELRWNSVRQPGRLINVLGLIPPSQARQGKTVIVGAHRDHFGRQAGLLFPGADDNASGTAILLEAARVLSQSDVWRKHAVLLVSFSGEEQGLLGSRFYISQPALPLSGTRAMLNVDHAGVGNGHLTVGLTDLPNSTALRVGETIGLAGRLDVFGFFPGGDHVPFKEAGIPTVTVVSSGPHPHVHRSTDTVETMNPEILQAAGRFLAALIWELANQP
jgi:hypothetical protein